MTHFKLSLLIISVLLIGINSCTKENIDGPLDGEYTGQVLKVRGYTYNSFNNIDSMSREISFEISHSEFRKTREGGFQDCIGNITIEGNEIDFTGGNCGCFCDCLPNVDCEGDIILGKYNFELINDSLIMQVRIVNTDTVELINGIYSTGWVREEHYTMTRN